MRLNAILTLPALACLLTACGGSTAFDRLAATTAGVDVRAPDSALTAPCPGPAALPARALTQAEVERYWGRDRAGLAVCRDRHSGLVRFYATRDAALRAR